jgi:uncharacterized protein (TIGR02588 family)
MLSRVRSSLVDSSRQLAGRVSQSLARWSHERELVPDAVAGAADTAADRLDPGAQRVGQTTAQVATTVVSLLLIAGLAGIILVEGFSGREEAPAELQVTVRAAEAELRGEDYYVPIVVSNLGRETVEEVLVAIEVSAGEEVIEETETVIAMIGEDAEAEATLVLDREPAGLTIEARVVTFQTGGS